MKSQSLSVVLVLGLAATLMAATVPGAPTNVTATSWPYTALISFTPPADNGGSTITSYTVTAVGAGWIAGSGPASPIMVQGGGELWAGSKYNFTVAATNSSGTGQASAQSNSVGCSGGTSNYVYHNGMFYWEGDYDYGGGTSWYADSTGHPASGTCDVKANLNWQPWSPGANFNLANYQYLEFDLKPTVANKSWEVGFENVGDISCGPSAKLPGTYGPNPPVMNQWNSYKIPLNAMTVGPGTANVNIFKFCILDGQSGAAGFWYADNVRFTGSTSTQKYTALPVAPVGRSMTASVINRTVSFTMNRNGTVVITDLLGHQLAMLSADHAPGTLSWAALSTGTYFARFIGNGTVETQRILVK